MSISVVFVVKNAIKQGYCFQESLLSCLPFADEIVISEGYSDDDTMKYLKRFAEDNDAMLFQDEWEESYHGEVIAKVSERAIAKATCKWIYYLQADEIIPPETAQYIKEISDDYEHASIAFPFYHFIRSWEPAKTAAYHEAVRMVVRGCGSLKGDGWTFDGDICPIYPADACPKPIYHFAWVFPKQNDIKDIEHAKIYKNVTEYQEKMQKACQNPSELQPYPRTDFDDFPELVRRFVGKAEYPLDD